MKPSKSVCSIYILDKCKYESYALFKMSQSSALICLHVHVCESQLGPNPSSLDAHTLGRGNSGYLTKGVTLYLVNQSYPFTVHFSGSPNGSSSLVTPKGKMKMSKQQPHREGEKRSIRDFFSPSPKKVSKTKLEEYILFLCSPRFSLRLGTGA